MTPTDSMLATRRRRERDCPAESWPHVLTAALWSGRSGNGAQWGRMGYTDLLGALNWRGALVLALAGMLAMGAAGLVALWVA